LHILYYETFHKYLIRRKRLCLVTIAVSGSSFLFSYSAAAVTAAATAAVQFPTTIAAVAATTAAETAAAKMKKGTPKGVSFFDE
ncbi:MAG: hypothetical protein IJZ65_10120, partial [Ruminiclostridium sp.]|nr:hypothetical protein [Ruminiclostridium sp.]